METNASTNASSAPGSAALSDLIVMVTVLSESRAFTRFAFATLLLIYVATVAGNSLLCLVVCRTPSLHRPMHVLVALLCATDLVEATNSLPRIMSNLAASNRMSLSECIAQMFFLHVAVRTQAYVLALMALDRYAAVVRPLRYRSLVSVRRVARAFAAAVAAAAVPVAGYVAVTLRLDYCRERVTSSPNCDFLVLSNLSCGDLSLNAALAYANVASGVALPLAVVAVAYGLVLRECSGQAACGGAGGAGAKARRTCVTHLVVVGVYFGSIFFTVASGLRAFSALPRDVRAPLQALQYVLPPALNPVVYGLRTAEIRRRLFGAHSAARVAVARA
ncbi:olfactory receptor 52D1-like [Petromyzon marinus]|uniref:Olfactory receptor 52D1-like n=1 Tax=Petromyzon marinus TaxID=7757 RepID=A0AAJ7UH11_PETMA|nr:olfactory receptor 52D1-like [Petromyzon marinus]